MVVARTAWGYIDLHVLGVGGQGPGSQGVREGRGEAGGRVFLLKHERPCKQAKEFTLYSLREDPWKSLSPATDMLGHLEPAPPLSGPQISPCLRTWPLQELRALLCSELWVGNPHLPGFLCREACGHTSESCVCVGWGVVGSVPWGRDILSSELAPPPLSFQCGEGLFMVPSAPLPSGTGALSGTAQLHFPQAARRALRTQPPRILLERLPPSLQKLSLTPQPAPVVVSLCIF